MTTSGFAPRVPTSALVLVLSSATALAQVLPFEGNYGNETGCVFHSTGLIEDLEGVALTNDVLETNTTSCAFMSILKTEGENTTVEVLCHHEGEEGMKVGQLTIANRGEAGFFVLGDVAGDEWGPLKPCP